MKTYRKTLRKGLDNRPLSCYYKYIEKHRRIL
ncbi:hypothetical protein [Enterococcus phage vB_Efs19_KEN17]